MSLLLKDRFGKYCPVICEQVAKMMITPPDCIWVSGVKKSILEEMGFEVYKVIPIGGRYYYAYLINEKQYLEYIKNIELPITMERL